MRGRVLFGFGPIPLLVGLFGFAALFGRGEVRHQEDLIAANLATHLQGEHKEVVVRTRPEGPFGYLRSDLASASIRAVHFETQGIPLLVEPNAPRTGRLRRLHLELRDFVLTGLSVKSLKADIPDCRFDASTARHLHEVRLSESHVGTGEARILFSDLAAFIKKRYPMLDSISLDARNGELYAEGKAEFFGPTTYKISGRLAILGGDKIVLTDATLALNGKKMDEQGVASVLGMFNPLLDLDKDLLLKNAFTMESLAIDAEGITAKGKATIPEAG